MAAINNQIRDWRLQSIVNSLNHRVIRFALSGGTATGVHWAGMWLLVAAGIHPALATSLGAVLGAMVNYLLQYHFSFQSRHPHGPTFLRYVVACALGWAANLILFSILLWWSHLVLIAQVVTTALVTFLNYFVYRRMVFHDRFSPCLAD